MHASYQRLQNGLNIDNFVFSDYFLDKFYEPLLKMSDDKVPSVRLEFSKALPDIKPYVDAE